MVVVVVVRMRPRAIPLAMLTMRKFIDGFPFLSHMSMGLCKLTIPDFKGQGRAQLSELDGKRSEKIAEDRIHVEQAIQRIKCYHIFRL